MRTIETTLYEFGELNQEAKQTAVKSLREQAAECGSDADWEDAIESIKAIKKMAGIKCDIQFSSQGHYCSHYRLAYESYPSDEEEREMWDGLMDNLRNMKVVCGVTICSVTYCWSTSMTNNVDMQEALRGLW